MNGLNKELVRIFCHKVRVLLKLTQGQMGVQMAVSKRTIVDWEAGNYMPITARLLRLVGFAPEALRIEFIRAVQLEALIPQLAVTLPPPARP